MARDLLLGRRHHRLPSNFLDVVDHHVAVGQVHEPYDLFFGQSHRLSVLRKDEATIGTIVVVDGVVLCV